ncbi:MAG: hypothetical protein ACXQT3_02875 [Methermicoccaceae archaeon]
MGEMRGGITPHRLTKADKSKGGKTSAKSLALRIKRRRHCNANCPIYPCFFAPLAERYGGVCVLNRQSEKVRQTFLRVFGGGQEGLKEQILQTLFNLMLLAEREQDFNKLTTVLRAMVDVCKTIYPDGLTIETANIQIMHNPQVLQLTQIILEEVDEDTRRRIIRRLEAIEGGADGKE